jgi:flagellar protein FliO/FliZ
VLRLPPWFFLLIIPMAAQAAEAEPGISTATYFQAFLALAFIVGLLLGTAWLIRKVSGGKGFGQGGMKVIGGIALGPRERLVLVEVGDSWLVIGIVPGQIRTLHQLPKGTLGSAEPTGSTDAGNSFAHILQNIARRQKHD